MATTRPYPINLGSTNNEAAPLLAAFDIDTTEVTDDAKTWTWHGFVPEETKNQYGTPNNVVASLKGSDGTLTTHGACLQSMPMSPSFFRNCSGITVAMRGVPLAAMRTASFVAMDTILLQLDSSTFGERIDTARLMLLDPTSPTVQVKKFLKDDEPWESFGNFNSDDWSCIQLCFAPPGGHGTGALYEPYFGVGDTVNNRIVRMPIFEPDALSPAWTSMHARATDDADGKNTPKANGITFDFRLPDTSIYQLVIYGGLLTEGSMAQLKNTLKPHI